MLFDIGHGMGSFAFKSARAMLANGFFPDTISSDVHALCIDGPAFDQVTTMSKFLCLGMELPDVIAASTANAAFALRRLELGSLKPGSAGDATILSVNEGRFDYVDVVPFLDQELALLAVGLEIDRGDDVVAHQHRQREITELRFSFRHIGLEAVFVVEEELQALALDRPPDRTATAGGRVAGMDRAGCRASRDGPNARALRAPSSPTGTSSFAARAPRSVSARLFLCGASRWQIAIEADQTLRAERPLQDVFADLAIGCGLWPLLPSEISRPCARWW